jgi:hypothetical protein
MAFGLDLAQGLEDFGRGQLGDRSRPDVGHQTENPLGFGTGNVGERLPVEPFLSHGLEGVHRLGDFGFLLGSREVRGYQSDLSH